MSHINLLPDPIVHFEVFNKKRKENEKNMKIKCDLDTVNAFNIFVKKLGDNLVNGVSHTSMYCKDMF